MEQLADRFGPGLEASVSPEPLGIRDVFAWELRANLSVGRGNALDDFLLLLEGLCYGLLETTVYDLANWGAEPSQRWRFDFHEPERRFLTVLKYRQTPTSAPTVAGSFAPDTLVCRAGVWPGRGALLNHVQRVRSDAQAGPSARGLLKAFLEMYPGASGMLWYQGARLLLERHAPGFDPGIEDQASAGPCLLRFQANEPPREVFVPQFHRGYLPRLVRALNGDYVRDGDKFYLRQHTVTLGSLSVGVASGEQPRLMGIGNVQLQADAAQLPTQTALDGASRARYLEAVGVVATNYDSLYQEPERRFRLPDALRVAYYVWGEAATQILRDKQTRNVYGPTTLSAGLQPLPDQITRDEGVIETSGTVIYVQRLQGDRRAYYVERCRGVEIGELTALGYALWKIFAGVPWSEANGKAVAEGVTYLTDEQGWLGPPAGLHPQPPDVRREAISWSDFLGVIRSGQPVSELFLLSAQRYAEYCQNISVPAAKNARYEPIQIRQHRWLRRPGA